MADDLAPAGVGHRDLALDDRDERIARVADVNSVSPTSAVRSSPYAASIASWELESTRLAGAATQSA